MPDGVGPTDWDSGERVFGPPRGTVDVDWLVPALLAAEPGVSPAAARAALERVWADHRAGRELPVTAAGRVLGEALGLYG
ncbi:MAG: hypothetical protein ACFCVF_15160 [Kineosporiaceae bacterium]